MRIGTPLSPGATKVMLLGAGELGKEVIIALQRLGVEVIAVDRYPHAPGHHLAHRWHVIDMTDPKALAKPWTTTFYYQNRPDWELGEISCSGDYLDFSNFESFSFKKKDDAPK